MESKSIFISSCSRRQLARRRPYRSPLRTQLMAATMVAIVVIGVIVLVRGWL